MNLVGEGAIVTGVLPDVFPVIDVENLATDGWAVAGWRPAWGGADITSAAAQRAHIQINNPAGSGVITVIELVEMSLGVQGNIQYNVHDALLTTLNVGQRWRDRRFPTLNRPVTQIREQSIVGTPIVSPLFIRMLQQSPYQWAPPQGVAVLVPGTGIAFSQNSVQQSMSINFWWRERAIEPAEQNI